MALEPSRPTLTQMQQFNNQWSNVKYPYIYTDSRKCVKNISSASYPSYEPSTQYHIQKLLLEGNAF
jgi:hypothetical protein